jgi:hypothetical protein
MDLVRFEAAANELLDSLGARLFDDSRRSIRTYLSTGEEGLAADELAGVLCHYQVSISPTERDLLHELLYAFELDDGEGPAHYRWLYDRERVLAELNVSGPPAPSPSPAPRSPGR